MFSQFSCDKCGECCRNIGNIEELKEFDLGNGVCRWLNGNLCKIYHLRPEICSVDRMYDKHYCQIYSKTEYYELNKKGCELVKSFKKDF